MTYLFVVGSHIPQYESRRACAMERIGDCESAYLHQTRHLTNEQLTFIVIAASYYDLISMLFIFKSHIASVNRFSVFCRHWSQVFTKPQLTVHPTVASDVVCIRVFQWHAYFSTFEGVVRIIRKQHSQLNVILSFTIIFCYFADCVALLLCCKCCLIFYSFRYLCFR